MKNSRPSRSRSWIGLLILTLALAGFLREAGHLDVDAYQALSTVSSSHAPLNLQHVGEAATGRTLVDSEDGSWTLFLATSAGASYPFTIEPRLSEIEGLYWTPLYKKGSCSYEFTIDCRPLDIRQRGGAGTIELEVRGLASVRNFREELRAIVEQAIEDWLEELRT